MLNLPLVTMLFIGVNLDFFVILLFLLQKYRFKETLIGYEVGMLLIFTMSAIIGQLIQTITPTWAIGFLGLIPIYMGIKGENDNEESAQNKTKKGIIAVLLMYLVSCGADNIAVYVPVLATLSFPSLLFTLVYFVILTFISLTLAYFFGQLKIIKIIFKKWGAPLSRIIYILIGLFVIWDTGLLEHVLNWF
ncbi:membrane protein [Leuconostoc litchii]|uniref:Permease n=1 Tax=Leuconostoc litchii TaxID=1981069 RepID=A0A6P2CLV2_9LACO|nr:cadmium resistance transporter [Leuconostoc litchii]TYC46266.1 hypothetical protein ESZ47_07260 [Leuconostoc litchii]GMA69978.1 membrane protein [Leuconostoc litchii]